MITKDAKVLSPLPQHPEFDFIVREISELTGYPEEAVR
jgi:hypothetical protein